MRVVREIPHPQCKITVYSWNNRYLIKLEESLLEQTFKIDQFEVTSDEELIQMLDATFIQQALDRFHEMGKSFYEARQRAEP